MTKLYIHIGHPKCGSSTIQRFLQINSRRLLDKGVGVVDRDLRVVGDPDRATSLVPYFRQLAGESEPGRARVMVEALLDAAAHHKKLVISAENLSDTDMPAYFAPLAGRLSIQVIYYIRRPDDWVLSAWKQWSLKAGRTLKQVADAHAARRQSFYRPVIEAWEKLVGRENIYVQVMDREALHGQDLIEDFCHQLGVNAAGLERAEPENQSFDYDLLNLLSRMPFLFDGPHDNKLYRFLDENFGETVAANRKIDPLGMEARKAILAAHEDENTWLKENFFAGTGFEKWFLEVQSKPSYTPDEIRGLTLLLGVNLKAMMQIRESLRELKKSRKFLGFS